jgi:hypothetical protein
MKNLTFPRVFGSLAQEPSFFAPLLLLIEANYRANQTLRTTALKLFANHLKRFKTFFRVDFFPGKTQDT